jgi:hypothetical protein
MATFLFFFNIIQRVYSIDKWPFFNFLSGKDIAFYSLVTNFTLSTKIENTNIDWIPIGGEQLNLTPYHYFEIWINLFYVKYLDFLSLQSFIFIVFPLLYTLFALGLFALAKNTYNSYFKSTVLALGFLLFINIGINWWAGYSFISHQYIYILKYFPIYLLSITMVLFYKYKYFDLVMITFLFLPFFNFLFYPLAVVIPPIIFVYYYIKKKEISKLQLTAYFIVALLIPISASLFSGGWGPKGPALSSVIEFYSEATWIKVKRIFVIGVAFAYRDLLERSGFVLLILAFLLIKRNQLLQYKNAILLVLLLLVSSLFISSALFCFFDASQLFTYVFRVVVYLSVFMIFYYVLNISKSKYLSIATIIVLIFMIVWPVYKSINKLSTDQFSTIYTEKYMSDLQLLMNGKSKDFSIRCVRIMDDNYYTSHYKTRSIVQEQGYAFAYFTNNLMLNTINKIPDIKEDAYGVNKFNNQFIAKNEYFYYYCEQNNFDINNENDLLMAQNQFIIDNKIDFIVTNNENFDGTIFPDFQFTLYTYDEHLKEYIYLRVE